jgi:glutathione peroxidase
MIAALALVASLGVTTDVAPEVKDFYSVVVNDIDGKPFKFESLKGQVVMVVNTASLCALTPQYAGLQELYEKRKKSGFTIIGFPANDFLNQEPGSNEEIKAFCQREYKITFPMMSKIVVKGPEINPLYTWLIAQSDRPNDDIEWNFAKFLVDRKGNVRFRYAPRERPQSPFLNRDLDLLIAEK